MATLTHEGPELNRPLFEFTLDPDKEPFPVVVFKVSDEAVPTTVIMSDGSVRVGDGATVVAQGVAVISLTDSTGGTANDTLENLADGSTYANDHAAIENNFADLAAKVNAILVQLRAVGVIAT